MAPVVMQRGRRALHQRVQAPQPSSHSAGVYLNGSARLGLRNEEALNTEGRWITGNKAASRACWLNLAEGVPMRVVQDPQFPKPAYDNSPNVR